MNQTRITSAKIVLIIALCIFYADLRPGVAAENVATDQLKSSIDRIMIILESDNPGEQWLDKKRQIVDVVKKRFDSEELAMRVLARHWRDRSPEEKEEFISLFSQVLENNYIDRLKLYSDAKIHYTKEIQRGGSVTVYTDIEMNQKMIPMNYRMKKNSDEWLVYDIVVEGVSLVRNYRMQFTSIIEDEDYDGLIRRMKEKIAECRKKDCNPTN